MNMQHTLPHHPAFAPALGTLLQRADLHRPDPQLPPMAYAQTMMAQPQLMPHTQLEEAQEMEDEEDDEDRPLSERPLQRVGRKRGREATSAGGDLPEGASPSAKRAFLTAWAKTFPWVRLRNGKIFCALCLKYNKNTKYAKDGGGNMRHSALVEHQTSKVHQEVLSSEASAQRQRDVDLAMAAVRQEAVAAETARHAATNRARGGSGLEFGIPEPMFAEPTTKKAAAEMSKHSTFNSFRIAYFIAKADLPTDNYAAVMPLMRTMGIRDVPADITSDASSCSRLIHCISDSLWDRTCRELRASPFYGIIVDETQDASTADYFVVYCTYVTGDGQAQCKYLCLLQVDEFSAEGLQAAIIGLLQRIGLDLLKLVGLSSDGAPIVSQPEYGASSLLQRLNPFLIVTHCAGTRVAVGASNAANTNFAKSIDAEISALFAWLVCAPKRYEMLNFLQEEVGGSVLNLQKSSSVQWLARHNCINSLRKCLHEVLPLLEPDDPALHERLQSYTFLFAIHYLSDILGRLSRLSRTFQSESASLATVEHTITSVMGCIREEYLIETPTLGPEGGYLREFLDMIESSGGMFHDHSVRYAGEDDHAVCLSFVREFAAAVVDNLHERFPQRELFSAMRVLVPKMYPSLEDLHGFGRDELEALLTAFGQDRFTSGAVHPALVDADGCRREWPQFKEQMATQFSGRGMADTWRILTASDEYSDMYPNFITLGHIAMVQPISTSLCELGHIKQQSIRDSLRSQLSIRALDDRLRIALDGPDIQSMDFGDAFNLWKTGVTSHRPAFRNPEMRVGGTWFMQEGLA
eukprot:jgi/Chlat1/8854/Chrsp91S08181